MASRGSSSSSIKVVLDFEAVRRATNNFSASQQIGNGGFGPVYKGVLFHTPVAVKLLSKDSSHGVAQFESEVRLLTALRHPNLVTLLGGAVSLTGQRCLVYELMTGGSAEDYLPCSTGGLGRTTGGSVPGRVTGESGRVTGGSIPGRIMGWRQRLKVLVGAARGLQFLHEAKPPVVHLDFKSSNILVDEAFNAKVGDFGLARQAAITDPSKTHASTRHMAGTYGYICPEYASTGHYDARCDVYSFGVTCLQMLTGLPAITEEGTTLPAALKQDLQRDDVSFSRADPGATWPWAAYVSLARLASACVRNHRAKRPWMGEVLDLLEKLTAQRFDEVSNLSGRIGSGRVDVEERRGHLQAVDQNHTDRINGRGLEGRRLHSHGSQPSSNCEATNSGRSITSDSENLGRGFKSSGIRPPYSVDCSVRLADYERDIVGPSALWAPARPLAPRKCARKKGDQIDDAREEALEEPKAGGVSWWPRNGGQTLGVEDTPRKEALHPEMPAAGGPSGGPIRGGLAHFAAFPPSHLRGASPAVRLASTSSSSGSRASQMGLVRR